MSTLVSTASISNYLSQPKSTTHIKHKTTRLCEVLNVKDYEGRSIWATQGPNLSFQMFDIQLPD